MRLRGYCDHFFTMDVDFCVGLYVSTIKRKKNLYNYPRLAHGVMSFRATLPFKSAWICIYRVNILILMSRMQMGVYLVMEKATRCCMAVCSFTVFIPHVYGRLWR